MDLYGEIEKIVEESGQEPQQVANDRQHGGDHYQSKLQHWDFIEDNGIGYLEGCATKYVARWRKKGTPVLDLEKALHYTEKLMEKHLAGRRLPRGIASLAAVMQFSDANHLDAVEDNVVLHLTRWSQICELRHARSGILGLLAEATNGKWGT